MKVMIAHRIISVHLHTCTCRNTPMCTCMESSTYKRTHTSESHLHKLFFLNFLKCKTRSCKYLKHMLLCLVAYELMDAVWERTLAVCSHRVINHHPWLYGNGLQTLSTPISCNYEPSERWIQGEYDFRLSGTSWLMVWWVRWSPVVISQGALSYQSSALLDPFFSNS